MPSDVSSSLLVRRPLPGLTAIRFTGDRPLVRAIPTHYGITMHLTGRSRWTSGGREWSSTPGSISLKVPGEVAVERSREGGVDFQVVLFDTPLVEEARVALDRPKFQRGFHAVDFESPTAAPLFALHRLLLTDAAPAALDDAATNAVSALVEVLSTARGEPSARRANFGAAVARARALLDERFTETIGLEELAAHARLDKFRLCRAFKDQFGLPPHAYVVHRRVALAQALLGRGMSQAEVAARVGFYDQSLLHRHFKRILRITPGAFARGAT